MTQLDDKELIALLPEGCEEIEPMADMIGALSRIQEEAAKARRRLTLGELPKGSTAIRRIENEAGDALARVFERAER